MRFPGAVVDVTECRQAEFALKESEARLQQALTAGQVMAFEWDPRTGLSQRSENTQQILGIGVPQNADEQGNDFLARVHPDDRHELQSACLWRMHRQPVVFHQIPFRSPGRPGIVARGNGKGRV